MSELPNPISFGAATELVTPEHVAESFACGPDVDATSRFSRSSRTPATATSR